MELTANMQGGWGHNYIIIQFSTVSAADATDVAVAALVAVVDEGMKIRLHHYILSPSVIIKQHCLQCLLLYRPETVALSQVDSP